MGRRGQSKETNRKEKGRRDGTGIGKTINISNNRKTDRQKKVIDM